MIWAWLFKHQLCPCRECRSLTKQYDALYKIDNDFPRDGNNERSLATAICELRDILEDLHRKHMPWLYEDEPPKTPTGHIELDERCECRDCDRLWRSLELLNVAFHETADKEAESYQALKSAHAEAWRAFEAMHKEHRAELYEDDESDSNGSSHDGEDDGTFHDAEERVVPPWSGSDSEKEEQSSGEEGLKETAPRGRNHGKFMVCDHCHSHGLPCDENPICEQCQLYETACIHRICSLSPTSKDDCSNPECRYAHLDYLPHTDMHVPNRYILLPGKLPRWLSKGRVEWMEWKFNKVDWAFVYEDVEAMQKAAHDVIRAMVEEEGKSLEHVYLPCGECCADDDGGEEGWTDMFEQWQKMRLEK